MPGTTSAGPAKRRAPDTGHDHDCTHAVAGLPAPANSWRAEFAAGGGSPVHVEGETVAFAWLDLSMGEAGTCMSSLDGCAAALARVSPSEVLASRWPDGSDALANAVRGSGTRFSNLPEDDAPSDAADVLAQAYGRSTACSRSCSERTPGAIPVLGRRCRSSLSRGRRAARSIREPPSPAPRTGGPATAGRR